MIPVPNANLAKQAWSHMAAQDCHPCGVLAYRGVDSSDVEQYMRGGGMIDADGIFRREAGKDFAFVASAELKGDWLDGWLAYAKAENLLWWQWFGDSFERWNRRQSATQSAGQSSTTYPVTIIDVTATSGEAGGGGGVVATLVTNQAPDPDPAQNPVQAVGQSATPSAAPMVDEVKDELRAYPGDPSGLTRDGQPVPRGEFADEPLWSWYYQGVSRIAEYFQIDMIDVPCLKICDSTRDLRREHFPLSAVGADQMPEFLTQIAIDPKFRSVAQAYRPAAAPHP